MKISLQVVTEKIGLANDDIFLHNPNQSKFSDIQLLNPNAAHLRAEILYIGDRYPDQAIFEPGCGLCLLGKSETAACDILYIKRPMLLIDLFNSIANIFNLIRKKYEALTLSIIKKNGFQHIIEQIYNLCENPVYLVDSSFKVLGMYGPDEMSELSVQWNRMKNTGYLSYDVVINLIKSNELYSMDAESSAVRLDSKYFGTPFISYCLKHHGKVQGRLFIIGMFKNISPADLELTDMVGPLVLDALRIDPDYQQTRGRYYEHFIINLIEGQPIRHDYLLKQIKALNWDTDSYFTVIKIQPHSQSDLENELIARELESFKSCKPVRYQDNVVALFPGKQYEQPLMMKKLKILSRKIHCQIGISDEKYGIDSIHVQYQQASAAIIINQALHSLENLYAYQDVAIFHLFQSQESQNSLSALCHSGILSLMAFDEQNNSNLAETLEVYLNCERHAQLTAKQLHIHRNSLSYRIEKINSVYEFKLNDPVERGRILLTFNIVRYLKNTSQ